MPALMQLQDTYGGQTIPVSLAAGLLLSAPTVLVFLCAQRLFARGLSLGQTG
jgi:multiple sugar transport system permease protein